MVCRGTEFTTSTTGLPAVTVIVSCTLPTPISTSMVAVNAAGSSTPSRTTVLNPVKVNVSA